jgi:hypothetical protein
MRYILLIRLVAIAALAGFALTAGCGDQPATPKQPTELELQATAIIDTTFVGNAEDWFAVEKVGGKLRLAQLHHPKMSMSRQSVSETEQMNGLTERAILTVNCRQYRYFEGSWSEWKAGSGENDVAVALLGPLLADWGMRLEKKNGTWAIRHSAGHDFEHDHDLLLRMMGQVPR